MQFFKNANYSFIAIRRRAILVSAILILIGLGFTAVHEGYNTSIDFAGGTLIEIRFDKAVDLGTIRQLVENAGYTGAEVTRFGSPNEILIKIKAIGDANEASEKLEKLLKTNVATESNGVDIRRVESVGPKIGSELKMAAFWAIIYSLAGIIVYISWRFEFRFAIAAILALIHDVLITLGFFSVTDREISIAVIAAVLTIVGYSLNDTIVVFDRIREDLRTRKREGYANVINLAINETLSRTIITSGTTLIVVIALAILGGPVIQDFALTLLVGIVAGTYSSIFIAAPILVEWEQWRGKHKRRK
jgi:preprotein translocase SecF subunit